MGVRSSAGTKRSLDRLTQELGLDVAGQQLATQLVDELVEQRRRHTKLARRVGISPKAQRAIVRVANEIVTADRRSPQERQSARVPVELIQEYVAQSAGMSVDAMLSPCRQARIVRARQTAMYLTRTLTKLSLPKTAKAFKKRDHTTVMWAEDVIAALIHGDSAFRKYVEGLAESIVYDHQRRGRAASPASTDQQAGAA